MKKRILLITCIAVVVMLGVVIGVGAIFEGNFSDIFVDRRFSTEKGEIERFVKESEKKSLDELTSHHFQEFRRINFWRGYGSYLNSSSMVNTLKGYNDLFPVEYINLIDKDNLYVVYKLHDDSGEEFYSYVFFTRNEYEGIEEREIWRTWGEYYYVKKVLSYSDYSGVKVGDSIDTIMAIDDSIAYDSDSRTINGGFKTFRLLADGILVIEFENSSDEKTDNSNYVVSGIEYYSNSDKNVSSDKSLNSKAVLAMDLLKPLKDEQ